MPFCSLQAALNPPLKADIAQCSRRVSKMPESKVTTCYRLVDARASSVGGGARLGALAALNLIQFEHGVLRGHWVSLIVARIMPRN